MHVSKNLAYALMALAAVAWGSSGVLTVLAIDEGASVNEVALYSEVFSAIIFLVIIGSMEPGAIRIRRRDFLPLLVFSTITGSLFSVAWYSAIDLTGVTIAVILLYSYPSWVTVSSIFLHDEKLTSAKAIALPVTFIGCVLVSGAYDLEMIRLNALGVGLGLFAAAGATIYYIWVKRWLKVYSAYTIGFYFTVLMIPALILITDPVHTLAPRLSASAWSLVFLLGLIPCTIGFFASMVALKRLEASKASIVASLEPVAAVALAILIIAEELVWPQAVGVALVVLGVIILRFAHRDEECIIVEAPATR
jgi:DME family drug/metabolite transporter